MVGAEPSFTVGNATAGDKPVDAALLGAQIKPGEGTP